MKLKFKKHLPKDVSFVEVKKYIFIVREDYGIEKIQYDEKTSMWNFSINKLVNEQMAILRLSVDIENGCVLDKTYVCKRTDLVEGKFIQAADGNRFQIKKVDDNIVKCYDAYGCTQIRFHKTAGDSIGNWKKQYQLVTGSITWLTLV